MRNLLIVLWMFFLSLLISSPTSAQIVGMGRLSLIQGDVLIQTKDTGTDWGAAAINTPLAAETRLWVPERGKAELQFPGGTYLRADENTSVDITDIRMDGEGNIIQVAVPQGRTYIRYKGSGVKNSVFQADTPIVSVMAYGPSKFKVDAYENGETEVSSIEGSVYVEGQNGSTKIDAGSMIIIDSDGSAAVSPLREEDDWDRWNQAKDSALQRPPASARYLPPALDTYSSDFDENGRWLETPDYGHVWVPTIVVSNWAPYRVGRWTWIGGDYVWVSYEPWGWVPYHYGRWAFRAGIGWFWVPPLPHAVFWCPGFVAWIHTPTYVSWVPLAPGEIYYGYGHYGPHSVNLINVNINTIRVTNVYVNTHIVNSVTVINRQTFITGRPAKVVGAPLNPFKANIKIFPGRPNIKAIKMTAIPNPLKVIPPRLLPSRKIETIRALKIANRPVAIRENVSVFKPGKQPAPITFKKIERPKPRIPFRPFLPKPKPHEPVTKGIGKPGQPFEPKMGIEKPQFKKEQERKPSRIWGEKPGHRPKEEEAKPHDKQIKPFLPKPKPHEPVTKGIKKPEQPSKSQMGIEKPQFRKGEEGKSPRVPWGIKKPQPQLLKKEDKPLADNPKKGGEGKPFGRHRGMDKPAGDQ